MISKLNFFNLKKINKIFSIILISIVSTFYIANNVLADPINFGNVEGQVIYNEQDNKLYYK